ncbi:MAG: glutathione peroxidase [Bacteroidetes bacterium]|jgi:glutathione peroxidase|nr:glutathione peroxidase [Bacteroidota bacterium]MBT4398683.1 glutathione peroxidase [Bacteroidota bacterium]MBT4409655.1 glutathione peroxidase [Bacteroidota bacterium]MBT7093231.1 glutathione peroxidase [Bacteroidota bacterium]MBT7465583.1 glutathione peroxidase [Bacteroidota bacterium]
MNTKCCLLITCYFLLVSSAFSQNDSFYKLSAVSITGEEFPFEQLRDKKVMIVNVASRCSLSPQYKALQELYSKYKDNGFFIIGFPGNDFANREPGDNEEICEFIKRKYKVSFPVMEKTSMKGDNIHAVYQWLTKKDLNGVMDSEVKWNFQKYLIDEEGQIHDIVEPMKKPDGEKVIEWIEKKQL